MKAVTKIIRILFRIVISPFVLLIVIMYHLKEVLAFTYHYIIYGGELIAYRKDDRIMMSRIYDELKSSKIKQATDDHINIINSKDVKL